MKMYLSARVLITGTMGKRRSGGDAGTHLCLKNVKNSSLDQARPIFKFGLGTKSIKSGSGEPNPLRPIFKKVIILLLTLWLFAAALIQPKLFFKIALTQESESSPPYIIILLVLLWFNPNFKLFLNNQHCLYPRKWEFTSWPEKTTLTSRGRRSTACLGYNHIFLRLKHCNPVQICVFWLKGGLGGAWAYF